MSRGARDALCGGTRAAQRRARRAGSAGAVSAARGAPTRRAADEAPRRALTARCGARRASGGAAPRAGGAGERRGETLDLAQLSRPVVAAWADDARAEDARWTKQHRIQSAAEALAHGVLAQAPRPLSVVNGSKVSAPPGAPPRPRAPCLDASS
jgi:hypothetical protein